MSFSSHNSSLDSCAFISPTKVISGAQDSTLTMVDLRQPRFVLQCVICHQLVIGPRVCT